MQRQILFNYLLKIKIYELGNKFPVGTELRDLNNRYIPSTFTEEFKKLIILEERL